MHHDMAGMHATAGTGLLDWLAGHGYALHRGCFLDDQNWVAAYVAANWLIAIAYTLISVLIYNRMRRAKHIPRTIMGMALLGIFVTCAAGHLLAGWTTVIWPGYRLETMGHWMTVIPAWVFLAHHKRFSLIVEGPHTIAETREQLAQKNRELQGAYEKIREIDNLKSQFFANVSHELRTPIALVLALTRRLQRESDPSEKAREDLQVIERNARTLLKHVNDLLDIAKMEAAQVQLLYTKTDLSRTVRIVAANFDAAASERGQKLEIMAPFTLAAEVDVEKIERVVMNLIANALKFTPEGGTIRCELKAAGAAATLCVDDSGPGVPSEMRTAIFERFRQIDGSATRKFGGTGLGLAIVHDFLRLHGGTIIVTGSPLGGARFLVTLPVKAPEGAALVETAEEDRPNQAEMLHQASEELRVSSPMRTAATGFAGASSLSAAGQPLILIVEDNLEMNRFLLETLAQGYRTESAFDGKSGLEQARKLRPDLILSDVMMPGLSGDDMVRELRRDPEMNDTPIIMLTAKADDDLRVRMLGEGAQDYIMKPFVTEEVRARVGNLISIKRTRQALQQEVASRTENLEALTGEVIQRKRELEIANRQLKQAILEAHHRIKNNLQSVSALLEMEVQDAEVSVPVEVVEESLNRIKAIAIVHDMLAYDQPIGTLNVAPVLTNLAGLLTATLGLSALRVSIRLHADNIVLPVKAATAVALITNELVNNAVKHSFALKRTAGGEDADEFISVDVRLSEGRVRLVVEDPGPGFAPGFDPISSAHIGLELISSLAATDLRGEVEFRNVPDTQRPGRTRGSVTIAFPPDPPDA